MPTELKPTLLELTKVSLKIGLLSFGGPAAQISVMHKELVEDRKWLSEDRFLHALNYCMLLPGPEAQQLATYCGWLNGKIAGGIIAGLLFILPGAIAMGLVSYIYVAFGDISLVSALFYGIKAGVLAIVLQALLKIGSKALKTKLSWAICALSFCALFFLKLSFPIVIIAAALIGFMFGSNQEERKKGDEITRETASVFNTLKVLLIGSLVWSLPPLLAFLFLAPENVYTEIAAFFAALATVSFGGAYALLSYMAQVAVENRSWLSASEMLDGLGLAETTPGPLILVTQFVGFLAGWRNPEPFSALTGAIFAATMTTWVTFAPSFLFVLAGAPWIEKLRGNKRLSRTLTGITAAVAGTILNLAVWFAMNVLFKETKMLQLGMLNISLPDIPSLDAILTVIALIACALTFFTKHSVTSVLVICALLGVLAKTFF